MYSRGKNDFETFDSLIKERATHHGRNFSVRLQELDNFTFVSRFHAREESGPRAGQLLFSRRQLVKLSTRKGQTWKQKRLSRLGYA